MFTPRYVEFNNSPPTAGKLMPHQLPMAVSNTSVPPHNLKSHLKHRGNLCWIPMIWWCYQIETFSALLSLCEGNPPVTGGFPSQRPVVRGFHNFLDLRLNKRLSRQSRRRWFETPPCSLWRHCNKNQYDKQGGWNTMEPRNGIVELNIRFVKLQLQ